MLSTLLDAHAGYMPVLQTGLQMLCIIGAGRLAASRGLFEPAPVCRTLNRFVVMVCLPALQFWLLAIKTDMRNMEHWRSLAAFMLWTLLVQLGAAAWNMLFEGGDMDSLGVHCLVLVANNTGILAPVVLEAALGPQAASIGMLATIALYFQQLPVAMVALELGGAAAAAGGSCGKLPVAPAGSCGKLPGSGRPEGQAGSCGKLGLGQAGGCGEVLGAGEEAGSCGQLTGAEGSCGRPVGGCCEPGFGGGKGRGGGTEEGGGVGDGGPWVVVVPTAPQSSDGGGGISGADDCQYQGSQPHADHIYHHYQRQQQQQQQQQDRGGHPGTGLTSGVTAGGGGGGSGTGHAGVRGGHVSGAHAHARVSSARGSRVEALEAGLGRVCGVVRGNALLWTTAAAVGASLLGAQKLLDPDMPTHIRSLVFIEGTLCWLARCCVPVSLFAVGLWTHGRGGGLLGPTRVRGKVLAYTVVRLLLLPPLMVCVNTLLGLSGPTASAMVLLTCVPVGQMAFVISEQYDRGGTDGTAGGTGTAGCTIGAGCVAGVMQLGLLLMLPHVVGAMAVMRALGLYGR